MPYYLLQRLHKLAMQVKKNKKKERRMYNHGLIKMMVEHHLQQQGKSWNVFLWENGFISKIEKETIQNSPPSVHLKETTLPPRKITRSMNKTKSTLR